MNINLPIYVEQRKPPHGSPIYVARPLFFADPLVHGQELDRLLAKLALDVGKELTDLGRRADHEALAAWTFAPRLSQQRVEVNLVLRRRTARCRFLFVLFRKFGRRVAFTPSLPDLWFDVTRGETLPDRALEVLTRHFRACEEENEHFDPRRAGLTGSAYVTTLDLTIHPPGVPPRSKATDFLMIGGGNEKMDGAEELRRVGRCLDWLYPEELDRAQLRDGELAELTRLLQDHSCRPVLLVGPRQVGKTALVHEYVYRAAAARGGVYRDRDNVWLLSPARLISGMSYVGQWENRLLAILKHARKRGHVLYCDDLLGLFLAGQCGSSSLSVAAVLKPYLERGDVRLLGEITPEALRVLRERDRGFADLFHLLPLAEPSDAATLRILIGVQRHLESQHRCRFHLDVLPTVLDLQRRYQRSAAFPGKAAAFLRQLAVKHRYTAPGAGVTARLARRQPVADAVPVVARKEALAEFHARSGLAPIFLDQQARLTRAQVLEFLAQRVIGQEAALQAAADALGIAKARLNDPHRPLASFLFLGPTGVGKTHCAKAIASFLFSDAERLLRFDLNEFNTPGAAARLVGTFSQPEGLLTSAIRRQPFAVVLFDEIEKADPEVFDLLLQVLGEGRLTDALGRTADFTNALIVLTSNLGVSAAESRLGFVQGDNVALDAVFVRVAERFFRPEFFNRLDRVLPFRRLDREQVRGIARQLIADVFQREGLVQRNCLLHVEPLALERIVDHGFDPLLGARALKRAVERQLTQRVAARLALLDPGGFTRVHVYAGPGELAVEVAQLEQAAPISTVRRHAPAESLRAVRAAVRRIEDEALRCRPNATADATAWRYFTVKEQALRVRALEQALHERVEAARLPERLLPTYTMPDTARKPHWYGLSWRVPNAVSLRDLAAALDINEYLDDLMKLAALAERGLPDRELTDLLHQAALLQTMAACLHTPAPERVLLWLHVGGNEAWVNWLTPMEARLWPALESAGLEVVRASTPVDRRLVVQGLHAWPLACGEMGTHLIRPAHQGAVAVQVIALPLPDGVEPEQAVAEWQTRRAAFLEALVAGQGGSADDPGRPGPVLRVYTEKTTVDFRCNHLGPNAAFPDYLLAALPLPAELRS